MKKYEFTGTNELSKKAFDIYSNSDNTFYKEGDKFFVAYNQGEKPFELGSIKDVESYLMMMDEDIAPQQKQRLFVDMDGTLAVFQQVDQLETLYEQGYFLNLKPLPNVVSAIKEIIENHPEKEVFVMSAILSDSRFALEEKNEWLDRYLPQVDREHRIFPACGENKLEFVPGGIRENDYLLDDYTANLVLWEPPAKGIKMLNGINHTRGTWRGNMLRYDRKPAELAKDIVCTMDGMQIRERRPIAKRQERVPKGPKL